jgi:hypothetical protein
MNELTYLKILLVLLISTLTVGVGLLLTTDWSTINSHDVEEIDNRQYVIFPVDNLGNCPRGTAVLNEASCIRFS